MTNTSRPRLVVPAAALAGGEFFSRVTGKVYRRRGTKWRCVGNEPVEKPERERSERAKPRTKQRYISPGDRARIKPYVESMTNWQRNQWVRGLSGGEPRSLDPRRLLFHVCFQKPPLKPLTPAEGQAIVDRRIDLNLARKMGQTVSPHAGVGLDGKRPPDPRAVLRAWKATKDFLARQRQRWMARATRSRLRKG